MKLSIVAVAPPRSSRVDHGAGGQIPAQESARLGEDEVGLVELAALGVEIRKDQVGVRIDDSRQRLGDRVAGFVVPEREVIGLDPADRHDDAQDLEAGRPERHDAVQARAALLDVPEVKARRVGDRLHTVLACVHGGRWLLLVRGCVDVVERDRRLALDRDRLSEAPTEIGVGSRPVAGVPARIHIELEQVGQPALLLGSRRLAARQRPERVEVDGAGATGAQVRIEKRRVTQLVVGVIADVLGHVAIEIRQRSHVRRVAAVGAPELVVLLPQVDLDQLDRGQQAQDRDVAGGQRATASHRRAREHGATGHCGDPGESDTPEKGSAPESPLQLPLELVVLFASPRLRVR